MNLPIIAYLGLFDFLLIVYLFHRKLYLQFQLYKKVYPKTYKDYNIFQVLVLYKLGFSEPILYAMPIFISFSNDVFYHNKNEEEIVAIRKQLNKLYRNNIFFIFCVLFFIYGIDFLSQFEFLT